MFENLGMRNLYTVRRAINNIILLCAQYLLIKDSFIENLDIDLISIACIANLHASNRGLEPRRQHTPYLLSTAASVFVQGKHDGIEWRQV